MTYLDRIMVVVALVAALWWALSTEIAAATPVHAAANHPQLDTGPALAAGATEGI